MTLEYDLTSTLSELPYVSTCLTITQWTSSIKLLETLFVNSALFKSMTEICSLSISQHCFMSFQIMTSSGFVYRIILLANNPKNQHTCIRSVITKSNINLEIMFEMKSKSCNVLRQLLLSNDLPSYGSMLKIWFCANKPAKWNGLHKSLYSNKHGINKTKKLITTHSCLSDTIPRIGQLCNNWNYTVYISQLQVQVEHFVCALWTTGVIDSV